MRSGEVPFLISPVKDGLMVTIGLFPVGSLSCILASTPRKSMRVILIEDNHNLARGIENALKDQGYAVDHLDDGLDADTFLQRHDADVAIIDINLPRLTGIEIIRRMRARRRNARADSDRAGQNLRAGRGAGCRCRRLSGQTL